MKNELLRKLESGQTVYGFSINYPSPVVIECLTENWDYVWLDGQHGYMGYQELLNLCIAARAGGVETIVRAPGHDFSILGPLADLCPNALMLPMVNNKEEAEEIVKHLYFPPRGNRSFWNTRMLHLKGNDYYKEQDMLVIAQIETVEGVENAEAIIGVDGIHVLMYGPADLGLSYGLKPGASRKEYDVMKRAAQRVISAAKAVGKYSMFIAGDVEEAKELEKMGVDIIVCGSDHGFLQKGADEVIGQLRGKGK